jgi:hypothetical protein
MTACSGRHVNADMIEVSAWKFFINFNLRKVLPLFQNYTRDSESDQKKFLINILNVGSRRFMNIIDDNAKLYICFLSRSGNNLTLIKSRTPSVLERRDRLLLPLLLLRD